MLAKPVVKMTKHFLLYYSKYWLMYPLASNTRGEIARIEVGVPDQSISTTNFESIALATLTNTLLTGALGIPSENRYSKPFLMSDKKLREINVSNIFKALVQGGKRPSCSLYFQIIFTFLIKV